MIDVMMNDAREKYRDIIDLPHHTSDRHPRMSRSARAAQFAPFAALTGHSDALAEVARITESRILPAEDGIEELERKLQLLARFADRMPEVTLVYFKDDERKSGGAYITAKGLVRRVDRDRALLQMVGGINIPFADIISILCDMDQQ